MSATQQHIDVRDIHPEYDRRQCPCCGTGWYYRLEMASGTYCPLCESAPLFRKLAKKYADHYHEACLNDDSNMAPPPYHHRIPKAMAYEISEELGFAVNHMWCMDWIWTEVPEENSHYKEDPPSQARMGPRDNIIEWGESPDAE